MILDACCDCAASGGSGPIRDLDTGLFSSPPCPGPSLPGILEDCEPAVEGLGLLCLGGSFCGNSGGASSSTAAGSAVEPRGPNGSLSVVTDSNRVTGAAVLRVIREARPPGDLTAALREGVDCEIGASAVHRSEIRASFRVS